MITSQPDLFDVNIMLTPSKLILCSDKYFKDNNAKFCAIIMKAPKYKYADFIKQMKIIISC
jgi:hypothetical protein